MSASQLILAALVVVAFAIGWWARGRRERALTAIAPGETVDELDAALGAALTSFQAALALWRADRGARSALGRQTIATFDAKRAAFQELAAAQTGDDDTSAALARSGQALDRLAEGLLAYGRDTALDPDRERELMRHERALNAARAALLLSFRAAR